MQHGGEMEIRTFHQISDEELSCIERRIDAATAGPWFYYARGKDAGLILLGDCNEIGVFKSIDLIDASAADQDFIVNARQDLPRLLLEVRSLRARLDALREGK
jgi:hypothetical protein